MTENLNEPNEQEHSRRSKVIFLLWVGVVAPTVFALFIGIAEMTDDFVATASELIAALSPASDWLSNVPYMYTF